MRNRKKKKGWLLGLVLALLLPISGNAQPVSTIQATLLRAADVTTAGYTYYAYGDHNSAVSSAPLTGVFGPGTARNKLVETSGLSTTISGSVAGTDPFAAISAGDLFMVNYLGQSYERKIVTPAGDLESTTVDAAIDLGTTGVTFRYKKLRSGTAAGDAWFSVEGFREFLVQYDVGSFNATSVTATLECRASPFAASNTIYTNAFTAVGSAAVQVVAGHDQCRIGWKVAGDAGANEVSTYFLGRK